MRRGTAVTAAVAVAVLAAGGGWLAGRSIKSPEQVALEAEPPPASLITVEVELAELTAEVITRADVGYDQPVSLSLSGAIGNRESALVVTWAPERGADLTEGSPALEIAGRPVFLLAGDVPVFRDLRPQDHGPDVLQLEQALARLGHFDGEPDELWDQATGEAVRAWYEAAGYEAVGVSAAERAELRAAGARLDTAEVALEADQRALDDMLKGPSDLTVSRARTDVASAQAQLARARIDLQSASQATERTLQDARLAHEGALNALDETRRGVEEAQRGVTAAQAAREAAARRYDQAQLRWQSSQAGVHPDTGAVPSALEHEVLRMAVAAAVDELAAAERATGDAARAVTAAETAMGDADREAQRLEAAIPTPQEQQNAREQASLAVRSAEDSLAAAHKTLNDLLAPPDVAELERRVGTSSTEVQDAATRLAELEASTGVWLPAGEVIVLRRLPVRVDLLSSQRGSTVSGSFMTVTGSQLAVRGSVSERDVDRVQQDSEARIEDRSLEAPIVGTIRLLDRRAGTRNVAPDRHYMEIVAEGIPDHLVGRNVKIVIPVGGTDGPALLVPTAALSATADGSTRVEVEQADASTRFVLVEPGLSTGGRVEVTPVDGVLSEGDRVVVGVAAGE